MVVPPESATSMPPVPPLVTDRFRAVAERYPERVAVEVPGAGGSGRTTYAELAAAAFRVAHGLVDSGAGGEADALVAILLDRGSAELYAVQLGTLFAGCAWVCLDAEHPDDRLRGMLEDARPVRVVTEASRVDRLRGLVPVPERVVTVEELGLEGGPSEAPPAVPIDPSGLAYVIYTSGTTGRPKGVMIEHHSLANLVDSDVATFGLGPRDRVVQGSSPIYDSSIEETWLALAVGGTVVVMSDAVARSGPDLVEWLRDARVTVFCPPPTILQSTGCRDPQRALPELKLLYVGGEALSEEIAARWGHGRWLENGYGPTECTVTVLRGRVEPGSGVTIGRPIAGHRAWVVDDALRPVPAGEAGELCIAGAGVARGYLGDPTLTAERFVEHPELGRIYRTGDLAAESADGFVYLGRRDGQVKIRGHRVELEDVDAALARVDGVRQGAALLQEAPGGAILVAWVVLEQESALTASAIRAAVAMSLPGHMVPARLGIIDTLPRTAGAKVDRRGLPPVPAASVEPSSGDTEEVSDPLEALVVSAFVSVLETSTARPDADFFHDLGGNSLAAALVVSRLREDDLSASATVRDLYEGRTARGLSALLRNSSDASADAQSAAAARTGVPRRSPFVVGLAQVPILALALVVASVIGWWMIGTLLPYLLEHFPLWGIIAVSPFVGYLLLILWAPIAVLLTVMAKRVLIGRYRAGSHPAWGSFHLRNWIVQRFASGIPWGLFSGTVFTSVFLRALGARVGSRLHVHRGVAFSQGGWDLLRIGDDVTLAQDAAVRLVDLVDGGIVVGGVVLGDRATVSVRAGVGPDAVVGTEGYVGPLTSIDPGGHVPGGQRYDGVPATPTGPSPIPETVDRDGDWSPGRHGLWMIAVHMLVTFIFWPFALGAILIGLRVFDLDGAEIAAWIVRPTGLSTVVLWFGAVAAVTVPVTLVVSAITCRLISPRGGPVTSRWAPGYARRWLATGFVERAGRWLSGTLFWPSWLRLAGMRIGRGCEISTIIDVVPSELTIGEESFFADGIYLSGARVHRGVVTAGATSIGRDTFLGNHAVVPAGARLPSGTLHGVCTVVAREGTPQGSSWFGHPAFELPLREVVTMPRSQTHEPGPVRYLTRLFFELMRFGLPVVSMTLLAVWLAIASSGGAVVRPTLASLAASGLAVGGIIALKWGMLGRVKPGQHALWSCWCSRWDFLYVAWGVYARPLLSGFEQTPFLAFFLRLMGCRIGRRALLGQGFAQVVDPDMIDIRDDATMNGLYQAHSFEDRVLKTDRVVIRERATVAAGVVLLYGADIGQDAFVAPHSVVMKRERLTAGRVWRGCPTKDEGAFE